MTGVSDIPTAKLQVVDGSAMSPQFERTEGRDWSPLQAIAVHMLMTVHIPLWEDLEITLR